MISSRFIQTHKHYLSLLAFCLADIGLLILVLHLSPAITGPRAVQDCGYTLLPSAAVFQGTEMDFTFSIQSDNKAPFRALKAEGISAFQDRNQNDQLHIDASKLRNKTDTSVSLLILIDVSRSMRRREYRKLEAVKQALRGFIERLPPQDRIAIAKFDESLPVIPSATSASNKEVLNQAIDQLEGKDGTLLYQAILSALEAARADDLDALVVFSDGVDGSPEANSYREAKKNSLDLLERQVFAKKLLDFEEQNEKEIIQQATGQDKKIRIFAVEMGNTSEACESIYVYRDSLANIVRQTGGKHDDYIDLVGLAQPKGRERREDVACGEFVQWLRETSQSYDKGLHASLSQVLEDIHAKAMYAYSLRLSLAGRAQPDGTLHRTTINLDFESENGHCRLPVDVDYIWHPGQAAPEEKSITPRVPVFLPFGSDKNLSTITRIYLLMMAVLGVLTGVPFGNQRFTEWRKTRWLRRAIIKVKKGSPYLGMECPNEGSYGRFREGDALLICPAPDCKLAHHLGCWQLSEGRCYRYGCLFSDNPQPLPESIIKKHKRPPDS